jgi:hypothetical protein
MTEIFTDSGKASFSRVVGTLIIMVLLVVYLVAAVNLNWETVRSMTGDLSLLAAGLYGFNKIGGYLDRNLDRNLERK